MSDTDELSGKKENQRIVEQYQDCLDDALQDWKKNPFLSMYECIKRRIAEVF